MMQAMIFRQYGPPEVLQQVKVETPVPKENEVLIKIHAASVTAGDCELRRFDLPVLFWLPLRIYFGLFRPKQMILGQEFSGEVVELGSKVTRYRVGDRVFASTGIAMGAYASYRCEKEMHPMSIIPEGLTYQEAATLPTGGINAIQFLRKANIKTDEKILIIGAGGSIGTYGVQIAKNLGAEITTIDHGIKSDMLKSIGASYTIDYTKEDFTKQKVKYDIILDVAGKHSFSSCVRCLNPGGRYIITNPNLRLAARAAFVNLTTNKKVIIGLAAETSDDLKRLAQMADSKKIKAVIDRNYPLLDLVDAHRYVETGLKKGNVVIDV